MRSHGFANPALSTRVSELVERSKDQSFHTHPLGKLDFFNASPRTITSFWTKRIPIAGMLDNVFDADKANEQLALWAANSLSRHEKTSLQYPRRSESESEHRDRTPAAAPTSTQMSATRNESPSLPCNVTFIPPSGNGLSKRACRVCS